MSKYLLRNSPYIVAKSNQTGIIALNPESGLKAGDQVTIYRKREWFAIVKRGERFNTTGWGRRSQKYTNVLPYSDSTYSRMIFPIVDEVRAGDLLYQYRDDDDKILYMKRA